MDDIIVAVHDFSL